MAFTIHQIQGSKERRCSKHKMESSTNVNICNKTKHFSLHQNDIVYLKQQNTLVYSQNSRDNFFVTTKNTFNEEETNFGPFFVGKSGQIQEVYSCSVNATEEYLLVCLGTSPSQQQIFKSITCHRIIYSLHSREIVQQTEEDCSIPPTAVFHPANSTAYFTVSYDTHQEQAVLKSWRLADTSHKPQSFLLNTIDEDCENLVTITCCHDYLILQVLQADIQPPYYDNTIHILCASTLRRVQTLEKLICAPCHTECTMNYLPDIRFLDGYMTLSFPHVENFEVRSVKGIMTRQVSSGGVQVIRMPSSHIPSLGKIVKSFIRKNIMCDNCIENLSLPKSVKQNLCSTQ